MKFTIATLLLFLTSTVFAYIVHPPPGYSVPALSQFKFIFEAIPWARAEAGNRLQRRKVYTDHVDVALQRIPVTDYYPSQLISLGTLNTKTGFSTVFTLPNQAVPGKYYLIAIEHWVIPGSDVTYSLNLYNQTFVVTKPGATIGPVPTFTAL